MAFSQPTTDTLRDLLNCATTWTGESRLLGNIEANEIVTALIEVLYVSDESLQQAVDRVFPHIILDGTIQGGFKAYGPFKDYDAAFAWAEENLNDMERDSNAWWIVPIESPQAYVAELQSILNRALEEGKTEQSLRGR